MLIDVDQDPCRGVLHVKHTPMVSKDGATVDHRSSSSVSTLGNTRAVEHTSRGVRVGGANLTHALDAGKYRGELGRGTPCHHGVDCDLQQSTANVK